jgi:hypothetical protein
VNQDHARLLLKEAAQALEQGWPLPPSLQRFAAAALRATAEAPKLPSIPGVQDGRGAKAAVDPYVAHREIVDEMKRRGYHDKMNPEKGAELLRSAINHVAAVHNTDERTIQRAFSRASAEGGYLNVILMSLTE